MNYSLKHVSPMDIIRWINEAISKKARIAAIVMDEQSHDSSFEPRYLSDGEVEKELIKLINQDDERYSLRFVIDVKSEIKKSAREGIVGIHYEEAKKSFPDLLFTGLRRENKLTK